MKSERASQAKRLRRFSSQRKLRRDLRWNHTAAGAERTEGQTGELGPHRSTAGDTEGFKTWVIGWDWSHCMQYRRIPHPTPGSTSAHSAAKCLESLTPPICSFFNPLLSDYYLHTLKTCLRLPVTFLLSHWGLFNALVIWDILMLLSTPSWKMPRPTAVWLPRHNTSFLSLFVFVVFSRCLLFLSSLSWPHQTLS